MTNSLEFLTGIPPTIQVLLQPQGEGPSPAWSQGKKKGWKKQGAAHRYCRKGSNCRRDRKNHGRRQALGEKDWWGKGAGA